MAAAESDLDADLVPEMPGLPGDILPLLDGALEDEQGPNYLGTTSKAFVVEQAAEWTADRWMARSAHCTSARAGTAWHLTLVTLHLQIPQAVYAHVLVRCREQ